MIKQIIKKCNNCSYFGEAMAGTGIKCGFLNIFFIKSYYPGKEISIPNCKNYYPIENNTSKKTNKKCKDCDCLSKKLSYNICSENQMIIDSLETAPKWCKFRLKMEKIVELEI